MMIKNIINMVYYFATFAAVIIVEILQATPSPTISAGNCKPIYITNLPAVISADQLQQANCSIPSDLSICGSPLSNQGVIVQLDPSITGAYDVFGTYCTSGFVAFGTTNTCNIIAYPTNHLSCGNFRKNIQSSYFLLYTQFPPGWSSLIYIQAPYVGHSAFAATSYYSGSTCNTENIYGNELFGEMDKCLASFTTLENQYQDSNSSQTLTFPNASIPNQCGHEPVVTSNLTECNEFGQNDSTRTDIILIESPIFTLNYYNDTSCKIPTNSVNYFNSKNLIGNGVIGLTNCFDLVMDVGATDLQSVIHLMDSNGSLITLTI